DPDLVDDVDAEIQVDRFITQNVLILLGNADHLVAPAERQDLRKARVEPHALENDVERDQISQEVLIRVRGSGPEVRIIEALRVPERPSRLVGDGGYLTVHIEEFTCVEAEALDDVLEGVGVDRLFEGLPQQILAAF